LAASEKDSETVEEVKGKKEERFAIRGWRWRVLRRIVVNKTLAWKIAEKWKFRMKWKWKVRVLWINTARVINDSKFIPKWNIKVDFLHAVGHSSCHSNDEEEF
jgi:hypothetical protein